MVFSAGEATLNARLPHVMWHAKSLGYKTKLDANGARPDTIMRLVEPGLLDNVALDFKCTSAKTIGLLGMAKYFKASRGSLTCLIRRVKNGLKVEIRTTYHPDLMTEEELAAIITDLDRHNERGPITYKISLLMVSRPSVVLPCHHETKCHKICRNHTIFKWHFGISPTAPAGKYAQRLRSPIGFQLRLEYV